MAQVREERQRMPRCGGIPHQAALATARQIVEVTLA